jgi:hypothetical protein
MAIPGQSPAMPHLSDYEPKFRSEMSAYSPARTKALLDLQGYVDRDRDAWREQPGGQPLALDSRPPGAAHRAYEPRWSCAKPRAGWR